MKKCPTCSRLFADESLSYCLDDGSPLTSSADSDATQVYMARPTTPPPTTVAVQYRPTSTKPARQGVNPVVVYVLIAMLALVVGGGIMALLRPGAASQTPSPTPTPKQESMASVNERRDTSNLSSPSSTPMQTPQPLAIPRQTPVTDSYPGSSSRNGSESEFTSKSCFELKIMRNEIFARHGYIFKTEDMRDYFSKQSWYRPLYTDVSDQLSASEKRETQLIKQYESRKGCS
jgi:hypothetical protein